MQPVDAALQVVVLIIALAIMAFGTLAAVLPIVPGPAVVWTAAVIYAVVTGFRDFGPIPLAIMTLLMLLGSTSDFWMGWFGIKASGGSLWSVLGSMAGMMVGMLVFFPLGGFIGGVVGALGMELVRTGDVRKAFRIGGGTLGGYVIGVLAEFGFAAIMDVLFIATILLAHRGV